MSHDGEWPRDHTERLFELYRDAPCLWKVKSKEEKDRVVRVKSLVRINEEMKTIDSSMTIAKMRKKIHTLRNQFRSEINKMNNVMKSGAGAEDSFTSWLWCFQLLSFLKDGYEKRPSVSSLDELKSSVSGFHKFTINCKHTH